eukprot:1564798-Prymnesium_polylepis.1
MMSCHPSDQLRHKQGNAAKKIDDDLCPTCLRLSVCSTNRTQSFISTVSMPFMAAASFGICVTRRGAPLARMIQKERIVTTTNRRRRQLRCRIHDASDAQKAEDRHDQVDSQGL